MNRNVSSRVWKVARDGANCQCNLRWQTAPHLRASNRKCSAANSGMVNWRLDEAMYHSIKNTDMQLDTNYTYNQWLHKLWNWIAVTLKIVWQIYTLVVTKMETQYWTLICKNAN